MNIVITSKQNSLVKLVRELRKKSARDREGLFVLEGPKSIREALAAGIVPEKLIVSEKGEKVEGFRDLAAMVPELVNVSDAVMDYISETETAPGIMALFRMPERSLDRIKIPRSSFLVILDGVQDPGNVGTIIRTADAFGAAAVVLTKGCADIYNAKVLRSTMGSIFHLPVVGEVDLPELTEFLASREIFTVATFPDSSAVPITEAGLSRRPLAVILGSEARGVSPGLARAAEVKVKIPTPGLAESLNVAVAAGIVLYEIVRMSPASAAFVPQQLLNHTNL